MSKTAAQTMQAMTSRARAAQSELANASHDQRNQALSAAADLLRQQRAAILQANSRDLEAGKKAGLSDAFIDRLALDDARIEAMAKGLEDIISLPDPLGRELARWTVPSGLDIARVATSLGVIGIIYESRPNVTVDAAGLCIKSGNAAILRGGSDSFHSSSLLARLMADGLAAAGLSPDSVQIVDNPDRALVGAMLAAAGQIDVIIPRGGKSLVGRVQEEARVPVFAHLEGICHLYVAAGADQQEAAKIAVNAKMRRTGICGAAETLLIDQSIAAEMLPGIAAELLAAGCDLRGDAAACQLVPQMGEAVEEDWSAEYLAPILSVRLVSGIEQAIDHIRRYGSGHTESILTRDSALIARFLSEVDSAIVMANASTQFADGGEFGMGAEIGIATGRLHARGPVGAEQLTSFKYVVRGNGQTRP
ncbi:MAG: glutamate-5-semialdehyde dehydrogenase [Alphaproteobacteria bacterium]|jgi:glutamate-5-semialdehyde dehydrogenase|nr:glutamate-5-semialdehyde dehydrogenase [Alphaproteobacteria bacterium]